MLLYTIGFSTLLLAKGIESALFIEPDADLNENPTNANESVQLLIRDGFVKSEEVAKVMAEVDFKVFHGTYLDKPKKLGMETTARTQHMYAYTLEMLKDHLKPGNTAMDVGCDRGYLTVCMAVMVGSTGFAVGVDNWIDDLTRINHTVSQYMPSLLESERVRIVEASHDLYEGFPDYGPYDAIHVGILGYEAPKVLLKQLKNGGRLVTPVAEYEGYYRMSIVDKSMNGTVTRRREPGVFRKVPKELNPDNHDDLTQTDEDIDYIQSD